MIACFQGADRIAVWQKWIPLLPIHRKLGVLTMAMAMMLASLSAATAVTPMPLMQLKESSTYQYLVTLPAGYDTARSVPLVIFLHGKGNNSVAGVQEWGPPARVMKGDAIPFLLAAPICSDDWWQGDKLLTVVREIISGFKVDRDRVYLTGCP